MSGIAGKAGIANFAAIPANDPRRTFAVRCSNGFDAGFTLYACVSATF
jgi:hypothetical protein